MQDVSFQLVSKSTGLDELIAQTKAFVEAAKAPATRKAYAADIRDYSDFCAKIGQPAFAAGGEILALYITGLAKQGRKATTTRCRRRCMSHTGPAAPDRPGIPSRPDNWDTGHAQYQRHTGQPPPHTASDQPAPQILRDG